jgi:hypothetical protein
LRVELRDAEPLKCALAKFELARFVEFADEVEREAETAAEERLDAAPMLVARLFIAVLGPALLAELLKERKLPVFAELRAAAFAVPPAELPNECQPGEVFARAVALPAPPAEFPNECQPGDVFARGAVEEPERALDCGVADRPAFMLPERAAEYPPDLPYEPPPRYEGALPPR